MSFLKHVGKIGDRKVAVLYREVPGEPHMALVTYTETLNRHIHDPMMKCIESSIGQQSDNLADALNRTHSQDGKFILQVLHKEGLIKKVQTSQVIMTPNTNTRIKLEELNTMLNEMAQGEAAIRRMAEIDQSRGVYKADPTQVEKEVRKTMEHIPTAPSGVMADSALANNLRNQATRMANEAKGLLAESQRLMNEAAEMEGIPIATQTTPTDAPVKRGRGRPKKVTTA